MRKSTRYLFFLPLAAALTLWYPISVSLSGEEEAAAVDAHDHDTCGGHDASQHHGTHDDPDERHDNAGHAHATESDHTGHDHEAEQNHTGHEDQAEHAHAGESDHTGHDHEAEQGHDAHQDFTHETIQLSEEKVRKFGIRCDQVTSGSFPVSLKVPGEITLNMDNVAHVVPRVPGIVRNVKRKLGDSVRRGEVMAVIDSRELADGKAEYLSALEQLHLAQVDFTREEDLWQNKVSSESDYLNAGNSLSEAKIQLNSSKQKLIAMGLSNDYLGELPSAPVEELTRFEILAPIDGAVIEKHITLGELVDDDSEIFVVADLRTVWVDLQVHERYLPVIRKGQKVTIHARSCMPQTAGTIDYVHHVIDEQTRTTLARVVLSNPAKQLRPGMFVNASVLSEKCDASVTVARSAVQYFDDTPVVFVRSGDTYRPRSITIGRSNEEVVDVVSGLEPGERVVTENSFRLKAEIEKRSAGDAGHGHAH